jgi:hypothetical protein
VVGGGGDEAGRFVPGGVAAAARRMRKSATVWPSTLAGKWATRPVRNSALISPNSTPLPYRTTLASK